MSDEHTFESIVDELAEIASMDHSIPLSADIGLLKRGAVVVDYKGRKWLIVKAQTVFYTAKLIGRGHLESEE